MKAIEYSPVNSPVKVPLTERINFRLIIFIGFVLLVVGYPVYQYLDAELSGGIKDAGNGYKEVDLRAMSLFSFDQQYGREEDVPQKWRDLNGQKVILTGEMWAPNSAAPEVNAFDLVYSIAKCCFSGPPQVQHFVKSTALGDKKVPVYSGLVKVKGTLHVNVKPGPEGKIASVYQFDVESVDPV